MGNGGGCAITAPGATSVAATAIFSDVVSIAAVLAGDRDAFNASFLSSVAVMMFASLCIGTMKDTGCVNLPFFSGRVPLVARRYDAVKPFRLATASTDSPRLAAAVCQDTSGPSSER